MAEKKEKRYVSDNAQLMAEWGWEKNTGLGFDPTKLTLGSHTKVWWKCSRNHEWYAAISDRNRGTNCPFCSGNKILVGYNDLESTNPTLTKEWNFEKNAGISPKDVMPNSSKKVWWKCSKGHEWQAKISHRNSGVGCPYCAGLNPIKGKSDLQTINPTLAKEWNHNKNNGLSPMEVLPNSGKKVWWICSKGHEWQAIVANRNKGIGCPVCNSERQTSLPEYIIIYYLEKHGLEPVHSHRDYGFELDIFIPSKNVAVEYDGYYWHKNKTQQDLNKNQLCAQRGIKLYRIREGIPSLNDSSIDYVIKKSQTDLSTVLNEILSEITETIITVNLDRDMIEIENLREHMEKDNSLFFQNTKLSKEWNYAKNGNLIPEYFSANSNKKVWWTCRNGHEWQAKIADRNRGDGCPFCSGRRTIEGTNDLQTVNSTLIKQWDYKKNGSLTPRSIAPNSHKKIWWICSEGHEWQAMIKHRNNGSGCPFCSGLKAIRGETDLQTINPSLAKEWNYEKNDGITPMDILPNSGKKVWWKCSKGHEWEAVIAQRNNGRGCPYCAGKKVLKGYNDLCTLNPILANEWNVSKNEVLTPMDVAPGSHKKVWWKCENNHEWQATINSRNQGNGCPECAKARRKNGKV